MKSTRRNFLSTAGAAALSTSALRAIEPAHPKGKAKHVIMIWLGGGAAQIDTWDPKQKGDAPAKKPGSYYERIPTAVPGVEVCEHLPLCAHVMDRITALRTVNHSVVDEHGAASYWMHTGRAISGTIRYPSIGGIVAHELGPANPRMPAYVVIGYPSPMRDPGFLGAKAGYLYLTDSNEGPEGFSRPEMITDARMARRSRLLAGQRKHFLGDRTISVYDEAIEESLRLAGPEFMDVFNMSGESAELRERYGSEFGQRCLMARRLVESGVRFVEVSHNLNFMNGTGWDTHRKGQLNQHLLIRELDSALSTLILDLERRGKLDDTLIVVNTEFGRPPGFDGDGGRGHQCRTFSVVLAGGGLTHHGAIGITDELSSKIVETPISVPDFHATIHAALGINPSKELFDGDRPVPLTNGGIPVARMFS
ncbi:MAG: hypothetical protein ACI9TH_003033 [Kiritimatiellia bacterium]|jgi:hypothetical protein